MGASENSVSDTPVGISGHSSHSLSRGEAAWQHTAVYQDEVISKKNEEISRMSGALTKMNDNISRLS